MPAGIVHWLSRLRVSPLVTFTISIGTLSTSAVIWAKEVFVPVMSAEPTVTLIVPSLFRQTMALAG